MNGQAELDAVDPQALKRAFAWEKRRRRRRQFAAQAQLAPATIWLTIFLLVPLGLIVVYAVAGSRDPLLGGVTIGDPTGRNLGQALSGDYLTAFGRALWFSLLTALATLALGYPLAYFIARHAGRYKGLFFTLVMIPFWTSYLARMFAWRSLLSGRGALNTVLSAVGLVDAAHPPTWLGSPLAVVLVLVYSFLPFMVLPLYISIDRLDYRLVEASYDLGAGKATTFLRVTLRQTLPGVLGGTLLVFVPCVGDFATAQIIGGNSAQTKMIGQQIQDLFTKNSNLALGSALSLLLIGFIVVAMLAYVRFVGKDEAGF